MDNFLFCELLKDAYEFQTSPKDWDVGRTGQVLLARRKLPPLDSTVIKWTDSSNPAYDEDQRRIHTEAEVLKQLSTHYLRVPQVFEFGERHGYRNYRASYLAMAPVIGLRVEQKLRLLDPTTRSEIARQLLHLLDNAHELRITNRDVDIKHLYWDETKQILSMIDWGNARIGLDSQEKDFAQDLYHVLSILQTLLSDELQNGKKQGVYQDGIINTLFEWYKKTPNVHSIGLKLPLYSIRDLNRAFLDRFGRPTFPVS